MDNLTKSIIDNISETCRGQLRSRDLAIYIGRAISWQRISPRLPAELAAPQDWTGISGGKLRTLWSAIAGCTSIPELRHAFFDRYPFPYERLSEETILRTQGPALATLLLGHNQRTNLANWIIDTVCMDEADLLNGLSSEISEFVIALLSAEENSGIFCPQPNIETVSIAAMKAGSTPIVVGTTPPVLAALFACITNAQFKFLETDPYQRDLFTDHADFKRDFALVVPPFGLRTEGGNLTSHVPSDFGARSSDVLGVELALRCTQEKAVVVVPNSLLFKGGAERRLREHLVERGLLEAVISFPSGLLANTNLPFSILVISKKRRKANNVRFCRVSERDHVTGQGKLRTHNRRFIGGAAILAALKSLKSRDCVSVGANDIQSQEYTLVPDRFFGNSSGMLKSRKNQTLALGEIVMIVKPQLLPESQEGSGVEVGEISPGEMPAYGYLEQSPRIRHVDEKLLRLRQSQIVYAGDVLLSTKGTIGKVALCRPTPGARPLLPSLASVILRFNPRQTSIDPRFLVMYLRSPAVQRVLDTMAVGVTVRNISLADLRGMAVWVPSLAEQNKLIQVFDRQMELENQVHQIVIEQDAISARLWQEIGLDQSDQEAA